MILSWIFHRFYNFAIKIFGLLVRVHALRNAKSKHWLDGRSNQRRILTEQQKNLSSKSILIHCASLGEFEQVKPLIRALKNASPPCRLDLSFFSPSGYNHADHHALGIDNKFYLPLDTPRRAKEFLDIVSPDLVILVRSEIWINHLKILKNKNIPVVLFGASFHPNQHYFQWYGKHFLNALKDLDHIYLQSDGATDILRKHSIKATLIGNGRINSAQENQAQDFQSSIGEILDAIDCDVIIYGSIHESDCQIISPAISQRKDLFHLLVPHDIASSSIDFWVKALEGKCQIYSEIDKQAAQLQNYKCLIIDKIGMLKYLYRYANRVYIGGGFKEGIHNIIEPAVYSVPISFGPKHAKFEEAAHLMSGNISTEISDQADFNQWIDVQNLNDQQKNFLDQYLQSNRMMLDTILGYIRSQIYAN